MGVIFDQNKIMSQLFLYDCMENKRINNSSFIYNYS